MSLENYFNFKENNTNSSKEILAGVTTFLAMAYILAVNPDILSVSGMPKDGVFIATALASFAGTLFMAFFANYPFALAPGMGLNAYFAFTVVRGMGYSWQFALLAVFVEGIIFLLLSLTKVREAIFNSIPLPLKTAVSVGIGLFIAFIAMQGAHIIVDNPATLVGFQNFNKSNINNHGICALLALVGVAVTSWMLYKKVNGAILFGILITWFLGIIAELVGLYVVSPDIGCFSLIPKLNFRTFTSAWGNFTNVFCALFSADTWTMIKGSGDETVVIKGWPLVRSFNFVVIMLSFMFVDVFDTLGTLIGVSTKAGMLDKNGKLPRIKGALLSDSLATMMGAVFGTSTVTTFVESASGVAAGGRTGFASVVTGLLFLLSILFAPIFLAIPAFATAPALIIVGFYMMTCVVKIDFEDYLNSIPAYIAILAMPFAYSISEGICLGVISWTVLNFFSERRKNISPLMYVLTILFLAKYVVL
ncbi:MAG: NCS2 family permease [Victivallales bacterium]|nr:NCS2 family permease [Victivallales bacterium]